MCANFSNSRLSQCYFVYFFQPWCLTLHVGSGLSDKSHLLLPRGVGGTICMIAGGLGLGDWLEKHKHSMERLVIMDIWNMGRTILPSFLNGGNGNVVDTQLFRGTSSYKIRHFFIWFFIKYMGAHYQDGKYAFFVSVFKVTWSHNEPSESQTKNAQLTSAIRKVMGLPCFNCKLAQFSKINI